MIHIFDGAMGTMLQAGGLKPGACPELMNTEHPEVVRQIHEAYIAAGSTIIERGTQTNNSSSQNPPPNSPPSSRVTNDSSSSKK